MKTLKNYLVVNMPLKLLSFLIENKILHQFITYVLRDQKEIRTTPEIIRFMSVCEKHIFNRLFVWINTDEGTDFWLNIDKKWQNS